MKQERRSELLGELVTRFSAAVTPRERADILRQLSRERLTHAASKTADFQAAVNDAMATAIETSDDETRLQSIALIGRLSAVVKSLKKRLRPEIEKALSRPLPPLELLKEADDRFYVATMLSLSDATWIPAFVAQAAVQEESGENARVVLLQRLLERSGDLASGLQSLVPWLSALKVETENPGDSVARRVRRIVAALRPQLLQFLGPPGDNVGEQLVSLIRAAFQNVPVPESPDVQDEFTEEVAGLTHDIVRTQLSLVTDAATYAAIRVPRKWYVAGLWARFAERSKALAMICRDLSDAVLLLAKQGITDVALIEQLEVSAGGRDRVRKILQEMTDRNPGLSVGVREWLRTGGKPRNLSDSATAEEASQASADSSVAIVLIEARKLATLANSPLKGSDEGVSALLARIHALLLEVDRLASLRSLRIVGAVGDEVEYSPESHEVIGGVKTGVRYVRMASPIVERRRRDGAYEIVLKAVVEVVR